MPSVLLCISTALTRQSRELRSVTSLTAAAYHHICTRRSVVVAEVVERTTSIYIFPSSLLFFLPLFAAFSTATIIFSHFSRCFLLPLLLPPNVRSIRPSRTVLRPMQLGELRVSRIKIIGDSQGLPLMYCSSVCVLYLAYARVTSKYAIVEHPCCVVDFRTI